AGGTIAATGLFVVGACLSGLAFQTADLVVAALFGCGIELVTKIGRRAGAAAQLTEVGAAFFDAFADQVIEATGQLVWELLAGNGLNHPLDQARSGFTRLSTKLIDTPFLDGQPGDQRAIGGAGF